MIVKNRIFANAEDGICIAGDDPTAARIEDNDIVENLGSGIRCTSSSSGPFVLYNVIARNGQEGFHNTNTGATIEYNHIIENGADGIVTTDLKSLQQNGIFGNSAFQCVYLGIPDQLASNNDWGSSDSSEIDDLIFDHADDPNVGVVQYVPFQRVDDSQPSIVSVVPADGDGGVDPSVVVTVTFSEEMRASTLNTDTVMLSDGEDAVAGEIAYSEGVLTFTPKKPLKLDAVYTLTLSSDIQEATYLKNHIDLYVAAFATMPDQDG